MRMYESVTRAIIEEMERGAVPWVRPWKTNRCSKTNVMPANAVTGRSYSGINIPILWASAGANGYPTHTWLTFKQALEHRAFVRKGERGTHVVFTKTLKADEDDEKPGRRSMLREYVVFNVAQIDGLSLPEEVSPPEPERLAAVEAFVGKTKADIRYGGDKACFVPSRDYVAMQPASSFTSIESFYATELHELGHWSGHKTRLDRDLSGRFGTRAYAAEELVAEFTAALTPVFLLSGVASLLSVLSTRLARVADRVDALAEKIEIAGAEERLRLTRRLTFLRRRSHILDAAVMMGTLAGVATSVAALLLFVGTLRDRAGISLFFAFGLALLVTIGALTAFLGEMLMASRGIRDQAAGAAEEGEVGDEPEGHDETAGTDAPSSA